MKNLTVIINGCVAFLLLIGSAVVFLVNQRLPSVSNLQSPPSLLWHLSSIALGLVLMLVVMRWQPSSIRAWSPTILIIAAGLLIAEMLLGRASKSSGTLASVLPIAHLSEWAKLAIVLIIPAALHAMPERQGWLTTRLPVLLGLAVAGLLALTFRGLSFPYVLTLTLTALVVALQAGRYRRVALGVFALVLCGMLWHVINNPYLLSRLSAYLFSLHRDRCLSLPERVLAPASSSLADPGGYDMINLAPVTSTNEWTAVTLVALFDWAGFYIVLLLFVVLVAACFLVSRRAQDEYDRLLGFGITTMLCLQVFLHSIVIIGLLAKGVMLPFVSAEGHSMLMFLVCLGLVLGIARRTTAPSAICMPGCAHMDCKDNASN